MKLFFGGEVQCIAGLCVSVQTLLKLFFGDVRFAGGECKGGECRGGERSGRECRGGECKGGDCNDGIVDILLWWI